ncbi:hypothetical protein LJ221_11365, partial [Streptomyces sp. CNQ085]|nr:hypothetical protein [Streptomyces sp. CNQ085]
QLYQGVLRQNSPTVVGFVTILVLVFLAANLLVDLLPPGGLDGLHGSLTPVAEHLRSLRGRG